MQYKALLVTLVIAVSCASAAIEIDWTKVRPVYEIPQWRATYPNFAKRFPIGGDTTIISSRIVGGEIASPHQFPYQVLVLSDYGDDLLGICGGSIVGPNQVLTAAHCIDRAWGVENVIIFAGSHDIFDAEEPNRQSILASDFEIHERWNDETFEGDVGIVYFPTITFNEFVQPVVLAAADAPSFEGVVATASGWGMTGDEDTDDISDLLRFVELPVIANSLCDSIYGGINEDHICTSGANGRNICSGDSGGPLTYDGVQIGVVSFGALDGCSLDLPAGYARVSTFREWIDERTQSL